VPSLFTITSVSLDGEALLKLTGELDANTVPQLQDMLDAAAASGGTVILDLTQLRFIDASGIRTLVLASQESRRDGFDLQLTGSTPAVMRALEIVGVLDELPFIRYL
jgi:anti-anti-sigma factor